MKTLLLIIGIIGVIIWASNPIIIFSPFKITFKTPYFAIGLLLLLIGFSLIQYEAYRKGKREGVNEVINEVINAIEKS